MVKLALLLIASCLAGCATLTPPPRMEAAANVCMQDRQSTRLHLVVPRTARAREMILAEFSAARENSAERHSPV
jgi:esterase/lipase superfamily enzyme